MTGNTVWFFQAMTASILWGVLYALGGQVLKNGISVPTFILCEVFLTLPVMAILVGMNNAFRNDIALILGNRKLLLLVIAVAICFVSANFMIATSVAAKNATLAAVIEIAYPLFTFLITWLVFGENQLNLQTGLGGLMIAGGIVLIYLKH